jgi:hypothetical protein
VEKQPVLAKKKTFFATTRVGPLFSGNSKGDHKVLFTREMNQSLQEL